MSIKKTQKQYFEEIIDMLDSEEHKEFIKGRIEALDKKSTSRKSASEDKKAIDTCNLLSSFMFSDNCYTVTELWNKCLDTDKSLTFQYVNARMKDLMEMGKVERVVEKGKTYFRLT